MSFAQYFNLGEGLFWAILAVAFSANPLRWNAPRRPRRRGSAEARPGNPNEASALFQEILGSEEDEVIALINRVQEINDGTDQQDPLPSPRSQQSRWSSGKGKGSGRLETIYAEAIEGDQQALVKTYLGSVSFSTSEAIQHALKEIKAVAD